MGLIANGGNAKSLAFEAIRLAKVGKIKEAREKLAEADRSLLDAHNSQTDNVDQGSPRLAYPRDSSGCPLTGLLNERHHLPRLGGGNG